MDAHQRRHRRARGQVLAHRGLPRVHGPVDRGPQHGVRELLPGQLELGAPLGEHAEAVARPPRGRPDSGPRRPARGLGGVELGPRDELLLPQLAPPDPGSAAPPRAPPGPRAPARSSRDRRFRPRRPGQPQPGARLLEGGSAELTRRRKSVGSRRASTCPFRTGLPRSTAISPSRPATLIPATTSSSAASVPEATTTPAHAPPSRHDPRPMCSCAGVAAPAVRRGGFRVRGRVVAAAADQGAFRPAGWRGGRSGDGGLGRCHVLMGRASATLVPRTGMVTRGIAGERARDPPAGGRAPASGCAR